MKTRKCIHLLLPTVVIAPLAVAIAAEGPTGRYERQTPAGRVPPPPVDVPNDPYTGRTNPSRTLNAGAEAGRFAKGESYIGETRDGLRHGHGTFHYRDGAVYSGEWVNDLRQGHGIYRDAAGNVFEGTWVQDKRQGRGVTKYANGDRYEGEYNDDLRHGQGRFIWNNGSEYNGSWRNDLRDGRGLFFDVISGTRQIVMFRAGELISRQALKSSAEPVIAAETPPSTNIQDTAVEIQDQKGGKEENEDAPFISPKLQRYVKHATEVIKLAKEVHKALK